MPRFRFLFALLLSVFAPLAVSTAPAHASPPTHYGAQFQFGSPNFTGLTPDLVAQDYVAYFNSIAEGSAAITGSCRLDAPAGYTCPYRIFGPRGEVYGDSEIPVATRCGPQYSATWDGAEFYCPPEPDCDSPSQ